MALDSSFHRAKIVTGTKQSLKHWEGPKGFSGEGKAASECPAESVPARSPSTPDTESRLHQAALQSHLSRGPRPQGSHGGADCGIEN